MSEFHNFQDEEQVDPHHSKAKLSNRNNLESNNTTDEDNRLNKLDFRFQKKPVQTWFEMLFPHFKLLSLNTAIIVLWIFVFLIQLLLWKNNRWSCVSYSMGCKYTPAIQRWQIHRLFLPAILHHHTIHLLFNSFALLSLGCNCEFYLGHAGYGILWVASLFLGNLFSAAFTSGVCTSLSMGANTVVMGIVVFEIFWFVFNWNNFGLSRWLYLIQISAFFFTTIFSSFTGGYQMNLWGVIGGGLAGFCITWLLYREVTKFSFMNMGKFAFACVYGFLAFICIITIMTRNTDKCFANLCTVQKILG